MARRWSRTETFLAVGVLGIAAVLLAVAGLWVYMSATAAPLHSEPTGISAVHDATPKPAWADAVERARQIARSEVAERNLPGLSIAVAAGGEIIWSEGFGWADIEARRPVTPRTRFRIGNASTILTSAAAGLLIEKGRLKLDDVIQTHVPEFPRKPWPVTLRHLMAHTAGLASDGGDEGPLFTQKCDRPVEAFQYFADRDLRFEPGTDHRFGNYGWIVVSAAIEAAAGEPFLTFMQRHIFGPLRMDDTLPDSLTQPIENLATPYFPKFAGDPRYGPDLMRPLEYSCYAGSSVFVSTPSDLLRFVLAINKGVLLRPPTVALLQSPQRLASGQDTGYGLGWDLETVSIAGRQTAAIGHHGESLGGVVSSVITLPEHDLSLALISNISYSGTQAIAVKIAEAFVAPK
ncbi:MAG TPA: serine hydrolase domain-containing protein [Vicinamibacterales bacterium]|nr:serine hydrolase domain-containing protein [Vicinamibacterales bacterium]